jgi:hypothetical protein
VPDPDPQHTADAELAQIQALRTQRHDLWAHRVAVDAERAGVFAAHDAMIDTVAQLAAAMRAWPDAPTYPQLAGVATDLENLVTASRAERPFSPDTRSDDLTAVTGQLAAARAEVAQLLDAAGHALQASRTALDTAVANLKQVNADAPDA